MPQPRIEILEDTQKFKYLEHHIYYLYYKTNNNTENDLCILVCF